MSGSRPLSTTVSSLPLVTRLKKSRIFLASACASVRALAAAFCSTWSCLALTASSVLPAAVACCQRVPARRSADTWRHTADFRSRSTVRAASRYGIPVTCKFRMGVTDDLLTYLDTGAICRDEGAVAIALHARTAEQHYAPSARWEAIAALKQHVQGIPVLGNGDIWTASDAVRMVHETGCDGVVIGRGCLGKPWLFRDLIDAFSGRALQPAPLLGDVLDVMLRHAESLMHHHQANGRNDEGKGIREFRKHCGWYLTGYPVGPEVRRRFAEVSTLDEVRQLAATLDRTLRLVDGGERLARGHTNGPIKVMLPHGYLDHLDDLTVPDDALVTTLSGG
ncbi:MAG: hypothetical protein EBW53_06080 [Actinobacteria bacterium]|nr:hypothetical protein [Actinomycetota bacterium]